MSSLEFGPDSAWTTSRPSGWQRTAGLVEVSITVSPIKDSSGRVIGASKIARDISGRRQAEIVQARLAAIVESSDDAIVSKTLDGVITSWNSAAERMFGYTESEAVGQHITLIIPKERRREEDDVIAGSDVVSD